VNASLREQVTSWIADDPDDDDRATLRSLLESEDERELLRRFAAPLTFGTAGLRGPEMAGPAGMNRATVRRATQGVLAWLEEIGLDRTAGIVVGRDARRGSERFNDEVVGVLLGAGAVVHEMPGPLPTPFVPYCVRSLGAVAGIMITASHNPPADNGYKLYARDGAQIVPPDDAIVERYASNAGVATLADRSSSGHHVIPDAVFDQYRAHLVSRFGVPGGSDLAITYTPLHGVGGEVMARLFREAGYGHVTMVERQFEPDGTFPTLPFPNPEEPGALDLAKETADTSNSSLIIANDPDADRLGVAVGWPGGPWRELSGDEIGRLLASFLLEDVKESDAVVATTLVSSTMLAAMAEDAGVRCATTLTGFKWIARAARPDVLGFGYEEALGFAVDPLVADKDGMSAALALCALADSLARRGSSLGARLRELDERYGVHSTSQLSIRAEGPDGVAAVQRVFERLRAAPPTAFGRFAVTDVVDLTAGWRGLAPTEGLLFECGKLARVIVRPSGTEAKLKAYIEVTPPRSFSLTQQYEADDHVTEVLRERVAELLRL